MAVVKEQRHANMRRADRWAWADVVDIGTATQHLPREVLREDAKHYMMPMIHFGADLPVKPLMI